MKKRTDQLMKCMEGVVPPINKLADELHTLNRLLTEGKNPDATTRKSIEKLGRDVGKKVDSLVRAVDAHGRIMLKVSETLAD